MAGQIQIFDRRANLKTILCLKKTINLYYFNTNLHLNVLITASLLADVLCLLVKQCLINATIHLSQIIHQDRHQ